MKKRFMVFALIIAFTATLSVNLINTSAAPTLKVSFVTGEYPPYTSQSLANGGAATELISEICKAAGITMDLKYYPWKRAESLVANGQAFGAFPYAITEDRKKVYDFSTPLYSSVNSFIYYSKNKNTLKEVKYDKLADLKKYKIGVLSGSFYEEDLKKAGINCQTTDSDDQTIQMLKNGRIDFILSDAVTSYSVISKLYPKDINDFKPLKKTYLDKIPNAILVSRKYKDYKDVLKKFNDGLVAIKKSGTYDKILKKYKMSK